MIKPAFAKGDVRLYGAVFDGVFHPLSERYATLAAARAACTVGGDGGLWILSLDESLDRVATQYTVNLAGNTGISGVGGGLVLLPQGNGIWDKPVLDRPGLAQVRGAGKFSTVITMQGDFAAFIVVPSAYPNTGDAVVPTTTDDVPGGGTAVVIPEQTGFFGPTGLNVSELHGTELGACTNGMTCEAWIRVNAWANDPRTVMGCWGQMAALDTFDGLYSLSFYSNSGVKSAYVATYVGGGNYNFTVDLDAISASSGWHHFAVQRKVDGNIELWVDGVSRGQASPFPAGVPTQQPWEDHWIGYASRTWPESSAADAAAQFDIANYRLSNTVRNTDSFTPPTSYTPDANTIVISDFDTINALNVPVKVGSTGAPGSLIWRRYGYVLDTGFSLQGVRFVNGTMGCFLNSPHNAKFADWSSYQNKSPMHLWTNSFANVVEDFYVQFARYAVFQSSNASINEVRDGQIGYTDFGLIACDSGLVAKHIFIYSSLVRSVFAKGSGFHGLVRIEDINTGDEAQSLASGGGIEIIGANSVQITGGSAAFITFPTSAIILNSCKSGIVSGFAWTSHAGTDYRLKFLGTAPDVKIEIHSPVIMDAHSIPFTNEAGYIEEYGVTPP